MVRNALSLIDNFNQLTPYAVGFERQFNRLNDYWNHQQQSTGFPPYNIQKVTDYVYEITMALAGFDKSDIEVEVAQGVLTVRSIKETSEEIKKKENMKIDPKCLLLLKKNENISINYIC